MAPRRKQVATSPKETSKISKEAAKIVKEKEAKKKKSKSSWGWLSLLALALLGVWLAYIPEDSDESLDDPAAKITELENEAAAETPETPKAEPEPPDEHFTVLEILPHDTRAFTQGLTYGNGHLWEGTGMYGESEVRRMDPSTGIVLDSVAMDKKFFGEGITFYRTKEGKPRLIQLSWQEKTGFIYNADTLEQLETFTFDTFTGEGWGITYNPEKHEFIVTDGSEYLMFWDADTLKETKRLTVLFEQKSGNVESIKGLNEVEYVDGYIISNIWYQDALVKIDYETGNVKTAYDFRALYTNRPDNVDCFNGISVTDKPGELWVTGKWWPYMYRIKLAM